MHSLALYGTDFTFPVLHYINESHSPLHAYFNQKYLQHIQGCYRMYSQEECDGIEKIRLEINLRQPSTQVNYTVESFKKASIPKDLWTNLVAFYEKNINSLRFEQWPRAYTYVNTWNSPSYLLNLADNNLEGASDLLENVWSRTGPILEEWMGQPLLRTSLYGIRVYKRGAVLSTHVDRIPQVISAVLQVAQDVDEPWPLEVYDHDGIAHNITLQAGEMLLYESHTSLHGRPFPLNGSYYANLLVHFHPKDYKYSSYQDPDEGRRVTAAPYGQTTTPEEGVPWEMTTSELFDSVMYAASRGDLPLLRSIVVEASTVWLRDVGELLNMRDENGWGPLHEAIRANHMESVQYLVIMGVRISGHGSEQDQDGQAAMNALGFAELFLPESEKLLSYLEGVLLGDTPPQEL